MEEGTGAVAESYILTHRLLNHNGVTTIQVVRKAHRVGVEFCSYNLLIL